MGYFSKAEPAAELRRQLQQQLNETRKELALSYAQFNYTSEPELVEACVYQIKALQTRSDFLLRQLKQLEQQPEAGGEKAWI